MHTLQFDPEWATVRVVHMQQFAIIYRSEVCPLLVVVGNAELFLSKGAIPALMTVWCSRLHRVAPSQAQTAKPLAGPTDTVCRSRRMSSTAAIDSQKPRFRCSRAKMFSTALVGAKPGEYFDQRPGFQHGGFCLNPKTNLTRR